MGQGHKFDVKKLAKLRDPERLSYLNPDRIWDVVGQGEVNTVVDLGAGIGFFAIPFARKILQGKVYACDLSQEMLANLKQAIRQESAANVIPVKTDEVAVPLADGIADLVLMVNLHHELDHADQSLGECRRLLRPGGRVAVIDWKPQKTPSGPPVHVRIDPGAVQSQLAEAGFGDVTLHDLLPYHYVITALNPTLAGA